MVTFLLYLNDDYDGGETTFPDLGIVNRGRDMTELKAVQEVFGAHKPKISSTKSLTGHSQGATGAHEAIYSLIMLKNRFIAASANVDNLDPEAGDADVVRSLIENADLNCVISNSFGFGGTNATLAFKRYEA